ncbi:hypothetical protein [Hanamia caeni]|nr:hypothetical protein [Hanamia caeni]
MRVIIMIGLCFVTAISFGQKEESIDSLVNEICRSIETNNSNVDSTKVFNAYSTHVPSFLAKYPENKKEEILSHIYDRLQRNCKIFWEILNRNDSSQKNWEVLSSTPNSVLNKNDCQQFLKYKRYKYLEPEGDSVNLQIENGFWIDHFKDGTFSKLKFHWLNNCEFEIEFIESNNVIRKGFSKPGDKYKYKILDKKSNYYDMSVEIPETNTFAKFKLFY